jgi:hypothetical protein
LSDTIWLAIIGAAVMCLKEYFDRRRSDAAEKALITESARRTVETEAVRVEVARQDEQRRREAEIAQQGVAQAKQAAERAAQKVGAVETNLTRSNESIKATLAESNSAIQNKLDKNQHTTDQVHDLVNGGMTAQMTLVAKLSRRIADQSGDAADIEDARMAEEMLRHNQKAQSTLLPPPLPTDHV